MKKLLLFAAMAAVALGASAGYTIEKMWEITDISEINAANCRQGLGMNGKFYINDKSTSTISVYDETGLIGTMTGSPNMTISRDEAGNIIMSNTAFPDPWGVESQITVMNPETGVSKVYTIPEDCGDLGRCDVLGIARGDMMTNGELYFTTSTSGTYIVKLVIVDGEVSTDDSYAAECSNTNASTTTPIYAYVDLDGNDALLYNRRENPPVKLMPDPDAPDNYVGTPFNLPQKGTTMGIQPFIWDGKELFLYNYKTTGYLDYWDGIAISEVGPTAGEPLVYVPATVDARANENQINWLWAEPDADGVTIYQYYPQKDGGSGGHLTVYRLTKTEMVYTVVGPDVVFGSNWDPTDEANDMVKGEDGIYTWSTTGVTLYGDLEFKVVGDHDYAIYEWPMGQNNWVAHLPEGEGIYDVLITFDPTAEDADRITCTLTRTGGVTPVEHTYTVAGTENLFGSNWSEGDTNNDMVKGEDGIYTWTKNDVVFAEDTHIEFKVVQDHSWTYNWPSQNWNADLVAGTYDIVITFDPTADDMNKITFTATRTDQPESLRGDVNMDHTVSIADVTALIDYLLSGNEEGVDLVAADCNLDEGVSIADVTALIDFLLSGNWSE